MSFLDRIHHCSPQDLGPLLPFIVDGAVFGHVPPAFAEALRAHADVFRVDGDGVGLVEDLIDADARTKAVNGALRTLADDGVIAHWRDEKFPVVRGFGEPPAFVMSRSAVSLFGLRSFGVHVNGYVRDGDTVKMWIGKRADDIPIAPGKYDQMVAGGQGAGLGLMENVIKESEEEAAIPSALSSKARSVGALSYVMARGPGVRRDTLFCYDLELPADFVPYNADAEMQGFELWPLDKVADVVRDSDDFKFNCSLVAIDFLIRHGVIAPDHPDYHELIVGLHQPLVL